MAIEYVGKGHDADLGLVRMGVRDYDPETNRFTTADPLFLESPAKCVESPGQCALYTYTQGDPLSFVDPSGLAITESEANARLEEIDATAGGDLHPSCILAPSSFPEKATAMRDTLRGLGELRMETAAAQWEQGNWASAALHYAVGHVASSLSEYYNPNWSYLFRARCVNPDGSFSPASRATLVPSANGGFRTAYPIP